MHLPAETVPGDSQHATSDPGRRLVRGSTLLLVGRLISILARFLTHVLTVRYLSQSVFGGFAYALAIVGPVQSFITLGLDRSVARFVPIYHEHRDLRRLFGTIVMTIVVILSLGLVAVLVLNGFRGTIGTLVHDDQAIALLLVLIFLAPIQALDDLLVNLFAVFAKPRAIFFRRYLLAPGLKLAVVIGFIVSGSDVFFIAIGYIASSLLGLGIYAYLFYRELKDHGLFVGWSLRELVMPWREVMSFSLPLMTTELVSMNTMSVVLLGYFWNTSSVAGYRAVFPASKLSELVTASFTTLFTPTAARMFARNDRDGINRLYWRTALWMAVASFPIFAATFSLAQPITVLLYGSRYADSAPILAMLSLGYYFNAAFGFNALTLQVFGKVRYLVLLNVATIALNTVLSLLLVPRMGALGAGIATMVAVIIYNVLKQFGLRLGTGISLFERRYRRGYLVIALGALGLLAVQLLTAPPMYVSLALAILTALFVVWANRDVLELDLMFPEVMRIPGARYFVRGRAGRDPASRGS
jgi:O-antigen/teichoic acid export membrane protein